MPRSLRCASHIPPARNNFWALAWFPQGCRARADPSPMDIWWRGIGWTVVKHKYPVWLALDINLHLVDQIDRSLQLFRRQQDSRQEYSCFGCQPLTCWSREGHQHPDCEIMNKLSFTRERNETYGTSRSAICSRAAWCSGRESWYMRNKTCTSVAALLDSCFNKFGRCFMKPTTSGQYQMTWSRFFITYRLSTGQSAIPCPRWTT